MECVSNAIYGFHFITGSPYTYKVDNPRDITEGINMLKVIIKLHFLYL